MHTLWNSPDFFQIIYDVIFFALVIPSLIIGLVTTLWQQKLESKNKKYKRIHLFSKMAWITGFLATILLWSTGKRVDAINSVQQKALQDELKATRASTDTLRNELLATKEGLTNTQELQKENEKFFRLELEKTHERISKSKNPIAPRNLSLKQKQTLLSILKASPDSVRIFCTFGDNESISYGEELKSIFETANWTIDYRYSIFKKPQHGLHFSINNKTNIPSQFNIINKAFKTANIIIDSYYENQKNPENIVTIVIGSQILSK